MTREQRFGNKKKKKEVMTSPLLKKGRPHSKSNKQKRKGEKQNMLSDWE